MFARGAAVQSALVASEAGDDGDTTMFDEASVSLPVCPVEISLRTSEGAPAYVGL